MDSKIRPLRPAKRVSYSLKSGIVTLLLTFSISAQSAVLSLLPTESVIGIGDTVALDIVVSGLGDGTEPSLGAFDVDLGFDSGLLNFDPTGVGFSTSLNGGDAFNSLQSAELKNTDTVFAPELSFMTAAELNAPQADSFTIATISFEALTLDRSS